MSKRKSKKSDKYNEISIPVEYLRTLSESGDEDLNVEVRRCAALEVRSLPHPR